MSALVGTVSARIEISSVGFDAMRRLRSALSLALALGILAVALPVAFGSGARGAGIDPVRVLSTGPAVAVDASGGAQLSVGGLVPGQSRSATIRVSNAGSGVAAFSLAPRVIDRVAPGGVPLSSAIVLSIAPADGLGPVLFEGALSTLHRLPIGQIGAGQARALRFTVTLPRSVGNEVQGSSLSAGFTWNAAG